MLLGRGGTIVALTVLLGILVYTTNLVVWDWLKTHDIPWDHLLFPVFLVSGCSCGNLMGCIYETGKKLLLDAVWWHCPCTCTGKVSKENFLWDCYPTEDKRCKEIIMNSFLFLRQPLSQHRDLVASRRPQHRAPGHILHVPLDQIFCRSVVVFLKQNQGQSVICCCRHSWAEFRSSWGSFSVEPFSVILAGSPEALGLCLGKEICPWSWRIRVVNHVLYFENLFQNLPWVSSVVCFLNFGILLSIETYPQPA